MYPHAIASLMGRVVIASHFHCRLPQPPDSCSARNQQIPKERAENLAGHECRRLYPWRDCWMNTWGWDVLKEQLPWARIQLDRAGCVGSLILRRVTTFGQDFYMGHHCATLRGNAYGIKKWWSWQLFTFLRSKQKKSQSRNIWRDIVCALKSLDNI